MRKILYSIFLCIIILFSGCTSGNIDDSYVVKFSSWGSESEVIIIKKLLSEFELKNPEIKIEFIHIPESYFQKLHLLFASKLQPDVIFINNINAPIYIEAGLLEDLSPYFGDEFNKGVFFKSAEDAFYYGGKIYAVPRDISNLVIYYNKDIFKNLGIREPSPTWTFDDFLDTAKQLKKNSIYAINYEENSLFWLYYLAANGGGIISDDKKSIIIDSTKSIEAFQFYFDLINKYSYIPTKAQKASKTSAQMFINKEIAMYLSGRWMVPMLREIAHFDWDIVEFPVNEDNKLLIDSSGWALAKNSKSKIASIKLIKFLSSEDAIKEFTKSGLIIPARATVAYSDVFLDKKKKPLHSERYLESAKKSKPTPTNRNYAQINDILNEYLESGFDGKESAKSLINTKLTDKLEYLMQRE